MRRLFVLEFGAAGRYLKRWDIRRGIAGSGSLCDFLIPFDWAFVEMVPLAGLADFGDLGQAIDHGVLKIGMTCAC